MGFRIYQKTARFANGEMRRCSAQRVPNARFFRRFQALFAAISRSRQIHFARALDFSRP